MIYDATRRWIRGPVRWLPSRYSSLFLYFFFSPWQTDSWDCRRALIAFSFRHCVRLHAQGMARAVIELVAVLTKVLLQSGDSVCIWSNCRVITTTLLNFSIWPQMTRRGSTRSPSGRASPSSCASASRWPPSWRSSSTSDSFGTSNSSGSSKVRNQMVFLTFGTIF